MLNSGVKELVESDLRHTWGVNIRSTRVKKGMSIREVALMARIDHTQLSRVEGGSVGIGDAAKWRLAAALGREVSDLFVYPSVSAR